MADALLRAYRLYGDRVQRMLRVGGVLQSAERSRTSTYCSTLFVGFTCVLLVSFAINFTCHHLDDLTIVTMNLGLVSSYMGPALKALCFLAKRESLIELHETLEHLVEEELARDSGTRGFMLAPLHMYDRPGYAIFGAMAMTVLILVFPTMLFNIDQLVRRVEPRVYGLSYPCKYPWAVPNNGFLFFMHLLYELLSSWCIVFTNGGVDGLFGYLSFQITSVLRAMSFGLANPPAKRQYLQFLKKCVSKHQRLLRCRASLENIYGPIIFWLILTNAVVMCALIHNVTTPTEVSLKEIVLFIFYMILKLIQTFTYGWYGSVIVSESEAFRQAIYFSEWPDHGDGKQRVKTDVIVTMLQKPMAITALKTCSVSVDMFVNVINTTLSYLFLLQTLDESK